MKLGMFSLWLFAATLGLLSSAQQEFCDELHLMIINEIRAYYDEFVDDQTVLFFSLPLLIMIKVGSNALPWEFLSLYRHLVSGD